MEKREEYFKGKKITVMGLGLLGRGINVIKFLAHEGAILTVTDLKTREQLTDALRELDEYPHLKFVLGEHRTEDFTNADMIIRAPNAPLDSEYLRVARDAGIPIEMDASLFAKLAPRDVTLIGVTGTRGKSTVTNLIFHILKSAGRAVHIGGNIRGLATLPLLKHVKDGDVVVLELDSWQAQGFGDSKISPHIAVFTTFLNDHMNYYKGDMQRYFDDKANIYRYQSQGDFLIVGKDVAQKITDAKSEMRVVSASDFPGGWKLQILGEHNRMNAALAREACLAYGLTESEIRNGIESFNGLPGRLEYLGVAKGVFIFNDNNATTPDATIAALKSIRESYPDAGVILIGGGADKELDFNEYKKVVAKFAKSVILFKGAASDKIKIDFPIEDVSLTADVESMKLAVETAFEEAKEGDVIVLSPGAASFGVFKNEYDRNDQFVLEINKRK